MTASGAAAVGEGIHSPEPADGSRPRWTWPALIAITAFAAVTYAWGAGHTSLEVYYQAAVRSMGSSWHDFFYGAFDPRGTITVDKLPGALWVQALSVRVFGYHPWAIVLPQIVEGVLTILVLFRAVSRVAGPVAGLVAASVMAVTPVTASLNRGNISDSLLVLLLVLAADATVSAIVRQRARWLLVAGLWVGLAFQAKMLQAWFVLPSIAIAWLLVAGGSWVRRSLPVVGMVVVAVAVSLSWMTVVSLMPRDQRPAVDGSTHDSEFQQVFEYNGLTRIGQAAPTASAEASASSFRGLLAFRLPNRSGPGRLLVGAGGRAVGWLVPAALLAGLALAWRRRRSLRHDPLVAGAAFWGSWLVVHFAAFSSSSAGINAYYLAALTPAIGALLGVGVAEFGPVMGTDRRVASAGMAVVAATVAYGAWLTGPARPGPRIALLLVAVVLVVAAAGLASSAFRGDRGAAPTALARFALPVAIGAVVLLPLAGVLDVVHAGLGPFDTPYQPFAVTRVTQVEPRQALAGLRPTLPLLLKVNRADRYLAASDSSVIGAPLIVDTGKEVEPIGGFLGANPSPSLATLRHQIATRQLQTIIVTGRRDPCIDWVRSHCVHVTVANAPVAVVSGIGVYVCTPQTATP